MVKVLCYKSEEGKTQEKTERGSRKRSSSAGSEKMERFGGRQEKMEGRSSTGQSPQWTVVPMEEEKEATNRKVAGSIPAGVIGIFH